MLLIFILMTLWLFNIEWICIWYLDIFFVVLTVNLSLRMYFVRLQYGCRVDAIFIEIMWWYWCSFISSNMLLSFFPSVTWAYFLVIQWGSWYAIQICRLGIIKVVSQKSLICLSRARSCRNLCWHTLVLINENKLS